MQEITTGNYKATERSHYYKFNLIEDSNIFLTLMGDNGTSTIYNARMEAIGPPAYRKPMYLEAGEYLLHGNNSSSHAVLNVYMPSESSYENLTSLMTGSYAASSFNNFYSLKTYQGGYLFLNASGDSPSTTVYDKNLNFIKEANYSGPTYLNAGEYIVQASYSSSPIRSKLNTNIPEELLIPSDSNVDISVSTEQIEKLVELYIAYFGRAAEHDGLENWKNHLDHLLKSGLNENDAFEVISNNFWLAATEYGSATGYDENMSEIDFVTKVYTNVLGRPDALENDREGVENWTKQLTDHGVSKGKLVFMMINSAHDYIDENPDDAISIYVDSLLENRTDISLFFAQESISGGMSGYDAIKMGVDVINRIDQNASSVNNVKNALVNNTLLDLPELDLVGTGSLMMMDEGVMM